MKKYISIICILATMTCFSACGDSTSSSDITSSESSTVEIEEITTEEKTESTTEKLTEESSKETTEKVTEPTTENTTNFESEPPTPTAIESTSDFVNAIGEKIDITDIIVMAADMIGAEEGTSFQFNGNKFEIYRFVDGDAKLSEASSGTLTLQLEGFGDYTMNSVVNGNYIMIYNVSDDNVIQAFINETI